MFVRRLCFYLRIFYGVVLLLSICLCVSLVGRTSLGDAQNSDVTQTATSVSYA